MSGAPASSPLPALPLPAHWLVSLRPVGGHAAVRRAAARHGVQVLALSPWRLAFHDDAATRDGLRQALSAATVLFTSPAAVRGAVRLGALSPRPGQRWLAVGAGTAATLRRAGIAQVEAPTRMDSEGLLALPALASLQGQPVGMVSAPGGRGVIARTLEQRGARVLRADVYARVPVAANAQALARLRNGRAPLLLALSSQEALAQLLPQLDAATHARLRGALVLAASARLAELARQQGFSRVVVARDARPASLLEAAADALA